MLKEVKVTAPSNALQSDDVLLSSWGLDLDWDAVISKSKSGVSSDGKGSGSNKGEGGMEREEGVGRHRQEAGATGVFTSGNGNLTYPARQSSFPGAGSGVVGTEKDDSQHQLQFERNRSESPLLVVNGGGASGGGVLQQQKKLFQMQLQHHLLKQQQLDQHYQQQQQQHPSLLSSKELRNSPSLNSLSGGHSTPAHPRRPSSALSQTSASVFAAPIATWSKLNSPTSGDTKSPSSSSSSLLLSSSSHQQQEGYTTNSMITTASRSNTSTPEPYTYNNKYQVPPLPTTMLSRPMTPPRSSTAGTLLSGLSTTSGSTSGSGSSSNASSVGSGDYYIVQPNRLAAAAAAAAASANSNSNAGNGAGSAAWVSGNGNAKGVGNNSNTTIGPGRFANSLNSENNKKKRGSFLQRGNLVKILTGGLTGGSSKNKASLESQSNVVNNNNNNNNGGGGSLFSSMMASKSNVNGGNNNGQALGLNANVSTNAIASTSQYQQPQQLQPILNTSINSNNTSFNLPPPPVSSYPLNTAVTPGEPLAPLSGMYSPLALQTALTAGGNLTYGTLRKLRTPGTAGVHNSTIAWQQPMMPYKNGYGAPMSARAPLTAQPVTPGGGTGLNSGYPLNASATNLGYQPLGLGSLGSAFGGNTFGGFGFSESDVLTVDREMELNYAALLNQQQQQQQQQQQHHQAQLSKADENVGGVLSASLSGSYAQPSASTSFPSGILRSTTATPPPPLPSASWVGGGGSLKASRSYDEMHHTHYPSSSRSTPSNSYSNNGTLRSVASGTSYSSMGMGMGTVSPVPPLPSLSSSMNFSSTGAGLNSSSSSIIMPGNSNVGSPTPSAAATTNTTAGQYHSGNSVNVSGMIGGGNGSGSGNSSPSSNSSQFGGGGKSTGLSLKNLFQLGSSKSNVKERSTSLAWEPGNGNSSNSNGSGNLSTLSRRG
jgi:hypothetical protein